jgi:ribA/ribD-fused uncharacterized protein
MTIYFYSHTEDPYGCFSNFSRHGIKLDDLWWPTTEHYFQAQKFVGTPYAERIRQAATPNMAAKLGRSHAQPLRSDWEDVKDEIMQRAVLCKFETHPGPRQILLDTNDEELVENATRDYYWGCGKDGSGKNQLGQTLVTVRTLLRARETQK